MDYLLKLLDTYENGTSAIATDHDGNNEYLEQLSKIIQRTEEDREYRVMFIADLTDQFIKEVLKQIDSESKKNELYVSIMYIKSLIKSNNDLGLKPVFANIQLENIKTVLELIKIYLSHNSYKQDVSSSDLKSNRERCSQIKLKLHDNKVLTKEDYDFIYYLTTLDKNDKLDEIMTYLNNYNLPLLLDVKVEDKHPITNEDVLRGYGVNVSEFESLYPAFFKENPMINKNRLALLESNGIDIQRLSKECPLVMLISTSLLMKNIELLKAYGFNIDEEEDYMGYLVLGIGNLDLALDYFIELGYNEFIHKVPSIELKNLRALIVKKLFYAYKNDLNIWRVDNEVSALSSRISSSVYDDLIHKDAKVLSDYEIEELVNKYPLLQSLDGGHRAFLFNDSYLAGIKRKTELKFGNKIISRIKTYSLFKILVDHSADPKDALLYALSYNSLLDQSEYNALKLAVYIENRGV